MSSFVAVPLALHHLGEERYGLWVTAASTLTMFRFADLGLSEGLITKLADCYGNDDEEGAREYVSSAFLTLTLLAIVLALAFLVVHPHVDWGALFNVRSELARQEACSTVLVLVACFLLTLPLGLVARIQMAHQETHLAALWEALGSLAGLAGILLAIRAKAGLPALVACAAGGVPLAMFFNGVWSFGIRRPELAPRLRWVKAGRVKQSAALGALFSVIQLSAAVSFQADNLVIAWLIGADRVPHYAVPMKLFLLIPAFLGTAIMPLWPAFGEAIARSEWNWVRSALLRYLSWAWTLSAGCSFALLLVGAPLTAWWTGGAIRPSALLLLGLGLWTMLCSVNGPLAMLLNAAGVVGFQVRCALLMALANVAVSIGLTMKIGLPGPVFGSAIAQAAFTVIPSSYYVWRLLRSRA
ncbi:MAG: oligosaccharide flippase family protein [Acidobacteria bacterium]|nr:oligosaccharide flippase family protein [Acidobacteriota bacterium]